MKSLMKEIMLSIPIYYLSVSKYLLNQIISFTYRLVWFGFFV